MVLLSTLVVFAPDAKLLDAETCRGRLQVEQPRRAIRTFDDPPRLAQHLDQVLALDLDPVAVSSAKENAALNGLSERIEVQLSDLLGVLEASAENVEQLKVCPILTIVDSDVIQMIGKTK